MVLPVIPSVTGQDEIENIGRVALAGVEFGPIGSESTLSVSDAPIILTGKGDLDLDTLEWLIVLVMDHKDRAILAALA